MFSRSILILTLAIFTVFLTSCSDLGIEDIKKKAKGLEFEVILPTSLVDNYELTDIVREGSLLLITFKNKNDSSIYIEYLQKPYSDDLFDKLKQLKIDDLSKKEEESIIEIDNYTGFLSEIVEHNYYSFLFVPNNYLEGFEFFPHYQVRTNSTKEILFEFVRSLESN